MIRIPPVTAPLLVASEQFVRFSMERARQLQADHDMPCRAIRKQVNEEAEEALNRWLKLHQEREGPVGLDPRLLLILDLVDRELATLSDDRADDWKRPSDA